MFFSILKSFNRINNSNNIIFYSEGDHESVFLDGIIEKIIKFKPANIKICILTSNNEAVLKKKYSKILNVIEIGSGFLRTWIFLNIKSKLFVMSLVDLGNFYLKKNNKAKTKYIYIFHSTNSMNAVYNEGALDNYDYIFCVGKHHLNEIREDENLRNKKNKNLIKGGCPLFDKYQSIKNSNTFIKNTILIAPSWSKKENSIYKNLDRIISIFIENHFNVIFRPHPMSLIKSAKIINKIKQKFFYEKKFTFNSEMQIEEALIKSEFLITDYSGIMWDYALGLEKKVIFLDVEKKIFNKNYHKFKNKPVEIYLRNKMGLVYNINEIENISKLVNDIRDVNLWYPKKKNIKKIKKYLYFNHGKSSYICAKKILDLFF